VGEGNAILGSRVSVPLVTPIVGVHGSVDVRDVKKICNHIGNEVDTVLVTGQTGGLETRTYKQRMTMLESVKQYFKGNILFCVGDPSTAVTHLGTHSGKNNVMHYISKAAEAGGVAAVVVPSLFYNPNIDYTNVSPTVHNFFMESLEKAKSVGIPLVMYNNPGMTGREIPLETVEELAQDANVWGIKDSSGNMDYFEQLIDMAYNAKTDFWVSQGSERLIADSVAIGADAIVPSLGNLFPKLMLKSTEVPGLQDVVNDIGSTIYCGYEKIVPGLTYALSFAGLCSRAGAEHAENLLTQREKYEIRDCISKELKPNRVETHIKRLDS